jgi:heterotetrameric sarcosine oxidase gamma subunit
MFVSAPEGLVIGRCALDIVEIGAWRGRARELAGRARARGVPLPEFGQIATASDRMSVCVRPERWLLLTPPAAPGAAAVEWLSTCAGVGAAIDLSSGLAALYVEGAAMCKMLARGCRLDLDPGMFPAGRTAATVVAQVSVILVALRSGLLLLTPATTARHLREWLESAAYAFGPLSHTMPSLADLIGRDVP